MKIGIFGSCVSRDTCEFIPQSAVGAYVARQSSIVSLSPVGEGTYSSAALDSAFQAKMYEGDQRADAVPRLIEASPDVVLVDLVDERHGVWEFSDGSFLTNTVEALRTGIEVWAPAEGAKLVEFGTDRHFALWSRAFSQQMGALAKADLQTRTLFLDIEWAAAVTGQPHPRSGVRGLLGRHLRRTQRRTRTSLRQLQRGESVAKSLLSGSKINETQAEAFARRASYANQMMKRYSIHARQVVGDRIFRRSDELRIGSNHKWGPEPYHYRSRDYETIAEEIVAKIEKK